MPWGLLKRRGQAGVAGALLLCTRRAHLPLDPTLIAILALLAVATLVAVVQARRRDPCLKSFEHDPVTVVEEGGDLAWGRARLYTTGLELRYATPVEAPRGHVEQSFIFYRDEYPKIEVIFRVPEGLSAEEQALRQREILRTARPGLLRRLARRVRNWIAILRDALVQAVGLVVGLAKARRPGVGAHEAGIQQLTSEIVGYAGTAFDPLLEAHLFRQVAVEVKRGSGTRVYCGWLKTYSTEFLEIVDAFANGVHTPDAQQTCEADTLPEGVTVAVAGGKLRIRNESALLHYVSHVEAAGQRFNFSCALPPGTTADLMVALPDGTPVTVQMGPVGRVDLVVPRSRALVRHAADGSESRRRALVGHEHEANRVRAVVPDKAPA